PTCRARTSTLFPYTTLFRSLERDRMRTGGHRLVAGGVLIRNADERGRPIDLGIDRIGARGGMHNLELRNLAVDDAAAAARILREDRKSTRLNSSHQIISYAV